MPALIQLLGVSAALITLTGCTPPVTNNSQADDTTAAALEGRPKPASEWQFGSAVDPLNDDQISTARKSFVSGDFTIDVTISCGDRKQLTYEFAAFDNDHVGTPYRWNFGRTVLAPDRSVSFEYRLDDGPPKSGRATDTRYSNLFTIITDHYGTDAVQLAQARRAVLRLPLSRGDATISLDQTDASLRAVVDPCIEKALAERRPPPPQTTDERAPDVVEAGAEGVDYNEDETTEEVPASDPSVPPVQTVPIP